QGAIREVIPIGACPSPPHCGLSLGFITEPRTVGRISFHLERPALPTLTSSCWILPTCPIVARQVERIIRTSPDLNLINTYLPSLPNTCALAPAERAICPPLPGFNSILWITVPTGIFCSGSALPTLISASAPLSSV